MKEFIVNKTPYKPLINDIEDYMSKVDALEIDKVDTIEFEETVNNLGDSILNIDNNISNTEIRLDAAETAIIDLGQKIDSISPDMMTSITYAELKALRDNSQLIPGMFYRITDYECTTAQEGTRAMNNKFDIIVQALSSNTLSENASADYHVIGEVEKIPVLMDSVITNKTFKSLVNIYYTEFTDSEALLEDYRQDGAKGDIIVEYGYQENEDGETVPVLYKTAYTGIDPTKADYNPDLAGADYEDVYYFVGTAEVDDVTYDKWRKIDSEHPWDSDSQIYIYTNVIVQDGSIDIDSDCLLIEVEGEPRLDCTKIVSVYREYVDFTGSEGSNYELGLAEEFKFAAYDYLVNNEGNTVPVLYDWLVDEGIPKNDKFFYIGKETLDGVVYDKWRKIDDSSSEHDWNAVGKMYFYTNEIVEYASAQTANYTFESSVVNDNQTLVEGAVEAYYIEAVDFGQGYDNELRSADEIFVAYDYLTNNKGVTVPVIYQSYEDEADIEQPYYYEGRTTLDGVEYDKWRKIEPNNVLGWESEGKYYCYTNIIITVNTSEDTTTRIDPYFANANLPAWELKYCLDNDATRFAWADDENGKGIIYYMKDEYNNECPYDFKNIRFRRAISLENGYPEYDEENGEETWVYTFCANSYHIDRDEWSELKDGSLESPYSHQSDDSGSTFHDNRMGIYIRIYDDENEDATLCGKQYLNNNVFLGYWEERYSANEESHHWYPAYCSRSNTFGKHCHSNTFGISCRFNTFGDACFSNTFGENCHWNTFGNDCSHNTFGDACSSNTFGNQCPSNTFGNSCSNNTFGDDCDFNRFGNSCSNNTFGNDCYNRFGNSCWNNTFGNSCRNNTFGNNFTWNTFGSCCSGNTFSALAGDPISYVNNVHFENNCSYIKLLTLDSIDGSTPVQNVTISAGIHGEYARRLELTVPRGAAPIVYEAAGTTHIILD